jgi:D-alanine-D-alanine ligase
MRRRLEITVMMDEGWIPSHDPDFSRDSVEPQTERHVVGALRDLGHQVRILGVGYNVENVVRELTEHPPDIVFNLVEQFADNRRLDKNVAGLLELMEVRFTGTGSSGLMLCRDKGLCKQLLGLHRIRVPGFAMLPPDKSPRISKSLSFPMVVKPLYEDASEGISRASLVTTQDELVERAKMVHEHWNQVAIAEEYVEGRELYVGIMGNKRLSVFPPRELHFGDANYGGPRIATARVKFDPKYRAKWNITYGFADLPDDVAAGISRICKRAFRLLHIRDYCRIDLRLTGDSKVVILEVNPNPDVGYGDDFAESADKAGLTYNSLIDRILSLAQRRYEE